MTESKHKCRQTDLRDADDGVVREERRYRDLGDVQSIIKYNVGKE